MVGNGRSRELCEALELARWTLKADHLRFLSSSHSRTSAATINTTMMLHGVDEAGASMGRSTAFLAGSEGERGAVGGTVVFGAGGSGVLAVSP